MDNKELKKAFHKDMVNLCKTINKQLKYKSPKLLDMINKYGGYEAAIKHIKTDANTFEFTILWEQGRLDLSVEALITKEAYKTLFPEEVITFCENRLKQYNYAPKKIEEDKVDKELPTNNKEEQPEAVVEQQEEEQLVYDEYYGISSITKQMWKEIFVDTKVFSAKNQDLIIKMSLMGGVQITPQDIANEEGYTAQYPYEGVITALAKRIKNILKIEVPESKEGKKLWWNILFVGWMKNNKSFEWSVRKNLKDTVKELIQENVIDVTDITVKTDKKELEGKSKEEIATSLEELDEISLEKEETDSNEANKEQSLEDALFESLFSTPSEQEVEVSEDEKNIDEITKEDLESVNFDEDSLKLATLIQDEDDNELDELGNLSKETSILNNDDSLDDFINQLLVEEPKNVTSKIQDQQPVESKEIAEVKKEEIKLTTDHKKIVKQDESAYEIKGELRKECLEYYGAICEICGFDYGYVYGEQFEDLISVYNTKGSSNIEELNPKEDMFPICNNCKVVIKNKTPNYTLEEMKQLIEKK